MCAIVGILNKNKNVLVNGALLKKMRDTCVHRGPDDGGILVGESVGLGHRRLSIVGLSTGHQPMNDGTDDLWIVFNGEIYNYPFLKSQLEIKGYNFKTQSDTEVIIHLYKEYGQSCVEHLNGMFAFAIWDKKNDQLFLARDRLGEKPLYYAETSTAFMFSSEIKALLANPNFDARVNTNNVFEYFLFRAVVGSETLFEGVKSLPPGHKMVLDRDGPRVEAYWDHRVVGLNLDITAQNARSTLRGLIIDAVRMRLMSEVPLGTFCSGGVDSSLVTAIAAKEMGRAVNTFSVGFHEPVFDETTYARMVSERYETNHHELKLTNQEFAELLPALVYLNDEPLNFSNSVHIYALSKLCKEYVTVVLTGEGADELFLGYPRYQLPRIARKLRVFSLILGPTLRLASRFQKDHRLEKLSYFLKNDFRSLLIRNSAVSRQEDLEPLVNDKLPRRLGYRDDVLECTKDMDSLLSRMSIQDQKTYLVSILNRQDKMSMGASVEARVPFLDPRIVEFANSLPADVRVKGFSAKMLVKQVAEEFLPEEVIYRKKSGFGVPLDEWFREETGLGALAERLFNTEVGGAYIDKAYLRKLFKLHRSGQVNHGEVLWSSVNFIAWLEQYDLQ